MLVLFDIDDTLVNHSWAFRGATIALHERSRTHTPFDEFFALWSITQRKYFDQYLLGNLTYEQQARARIRAVFDPTLRDDAADRLFATYLDSYESGWTLFPDVVPSLNQLSSHRLGVISNGQGLQQRRKLERLGIIDRFEGIVISEDCGVPKPKAEIFEYACKSLGESVTRAVYVGDLYDVDAVGARQAGMTRVWLDRDGRSTSDHVSPIVGSLRDLPALIVRLPSTF